MDAFYASVEQRDNPALRGIPLVVGGSPDGRGVVATASYEARKFGVHSAMSSRRALQLCPQATFVKPRFDAYKEASQKIREIFSRYTDLIEPLSLDEAYLDVTEDKQGIGSALDIAAAIKKAIKEELQLTASAGVSINKFVAKIASDLKKPDGLSFIGPSQIEKFMEQLPVEKFHGVGKVTAAKMKELGMHTGGDLKKYPENELVRHFGKAGYFYYRIVRGIDDRNVEPNRETKSIGAEDTFQTDLKDPEFMYEEIDKLSRIVASRLEKKNLRGRTLTLKVKYADFTQITRSRSFPEPVEGHLQIAGEAKRLLDATDHSGKAVRLLGVTLASFNEPAVAEKGSGETQLTLF